MALINCPNCGAKISDKARKCPKCGVDPKQRVEEKQIAEDSHAAEVDSTPENQQDPQYLKEYEEPSTRKPWWIFSIIVVIIVGSIFVPLYTQQNNQATSYEQNDSIAAAELEADRIEWIAAEDVAVADTVAPDIPIEEAKQEQKEEKCPEWLQGNWRCQTQYGEARVGISGDIISVWFDGEHFYTGSFEVRNNELVYDRRNGSAYTLQFDRRRKCLMMDDNHPMSRF